MPFLLCKFLFYLYGYFSLNFIFVCQLEELFLHEISFVHTLAISICSIQIRKRKSHLNVQLLKYLYVEIKVFDLNDLLAQRPQR